MSLDEYKEKRKFDRTPEPGNDDAETTGAGPVFVVQRHDASHLHWDLRLEAGGVLKSWAVPKGPSMDTKDKRLAVQVEDHPLEYAEFEGVIPEGNYGAGTVEIWDEGVYDYIGKYRNIEEAVEQGNLELNLHGHRLKGLFALVRTNMDGRVKNWLLMKKEDEYALHGGYDAADIPGYKPGSPA